MLNFKIGAEPFLSCARQVFLHDGDWPILMPSRVSQNLSRYGSLRRIRDTLTNYHSSGRAEARC
jgi:hypothetical protein